MSDKQNPIMDWLAAGAAIAALGAISPPAAGAAAVTMGVHQLYSWAERTRERDKGPDKAE